MSYRQVNSSLWTGDVARALRGNMDGWTVANYILHGPESCTSSIGVFRLSLATLSDAIGLSMDRLSIAVRSVIDTGFAAYDETYRMWIVFEVARHRYGEEPNPSRKEVKGLIAALPGMMSVASKSFVWRLLRERYAGVWDPIFEAAGVEPLTAMDRLSIADRTPIDTGIREEGRKEEGKREPPPPPVDGGQPPGDEPDAAPIPKWAADAAKGSGFAGRELLGEICRCVRTVHGKAPDPTKVKTSADPILKLWRALGRPFDFFEDFRLVAEAAHVCGAKIFARDIRAEGWAEGSDRQFMVATIARQEPWAERIATAKAWASSGRPAPQAEPPPWSEKLRAPAACNPPAIDIRARLGALAARMPEGMAFQRERIAALARSTDGEDAARVEEALVVVEKSILADLPGILGPEVMAELEGKRDAHILRLRSKMSTDQLTAAGRELLEKLMRDKADLPELSLFAPEVTP